MAAADEAAGRDDDGSAGATNIERFLDAVTPSPASSRLGDVWAFYDLAFGLEVALQFDGEETVRALSMALEARRAAETLCVRGQPVHMYFVPYLSGIRLLEPPVGDDPARVAFQYSEHERLQDRLPFAMKMAELDTLFGALSSSRAEDYDRKASWYCVSWQPIYAVPSLPRQQLEMGKQFVLTKITAVHRIARVISIGKFLRAQNLKREAELRRNRLSLLQFATGEAGGISDRCKHSVAQFLVRYLGQQYRIHPA